MIPRPLRDRMEIIEVSGYAQEDKIPIATGHLVPKQVKLHGLEGKEVQFTEDAIKMIGEFEANL